MGAGRTMECLDAGLAIWGRLCRRRKDNKPARVSWQRELPMIGGNAQRPSESTPLAGHAARAVRQSGMAEIRNNKAHASGKFMPGCLLLGVQGISTRGGTAWEWVCKRGGRQTRIGRGRVQAGRQAGRQPCPASSKPLGFPDSTEALLEAVWGAT